MTTMLCVVSLYSYMLFRDPAGVPHVCVTYHPIE